jgi:hypothetical protein
MLFKSICFFVASFNVGAIFRKVFKKWFENYETRVLMFGIDAAKKTTVLCKLKFGERVTKILTIE